MKKTVVFFGSIGIAKKILEEILLKKEIELIGVCCDSNINSWRNEESVYDFCIKKGIALLSERDIVSAKPDLGVSVRYNRIITKEIIDSFQLGIVNTHGGILPEYRGSYCNINAIINNEKEYGVTLHYIDEGVDSGDIIDIKKIDISEAITGFELYKLSEQLCYDLIKENIQAILDSTNKRVPQSEYIAKGHAVHEYKAKETLALKEIKPEEIQDEKTLRIIRAFDSDHHEPAYLFGKKIYLRSKY